MGSGPLVCLGRTGGRRARGSARGRKNSNDCKLDSRGRLIAPIAITIDGRSVVGVGVDSARPTVPLPQIQPFPG